MTWKHHFNRARQSHAPVSVEKKQVGPLPNGFESNGLSINGLWGVYERQQGVETITITELPSQYRVSVSNTVTGNNLRQPRVTGNQQGNTLKRAAAIGLGALGVAAIGKALGGSQSSRAPDPKQAHRVFISHSWRYEDHYEEVKQLLDDAYGFEYFDHSVSSDEPLDAQLPNHLRKKFGDQIRSTSVVLVLAGMYVAHSEAIQDEIEIATQMGKPIVGVIPQGNKQVPRLVKENAAELVEADGNEILNAIERHTT